MDYATKQQNGRTYKKPEIEVPVNPARVVQHVGKVGGDFEFSGPSWPGLMPAYDLDE